MECQSSYVRTAVRLSSGLSDCESLYEVALETLDIQGAGMTFLIRSLMRRSSRSMQSLGIRPPNSVCSARRHCGKQVLLCSYIHASRPRFQSRFIALTRHCPLFPRPPWPQRGCNQTHWLAIDGSSGLYTFSCSSPHLSSTASDQSSAACSVS